ncbi:SRPBCC family protein [Streptomyces sp. HMX87]|uniref:SRPBCC family protein n=1 Tax=Streptomyces sp. HMX87 TaxID=3390849 RepID=UPI003A84FDBB
MVRIGVLAAVTAAGAGAAAGYLGLLTGAVPLDLGVGRRTRPLGPRSVGIAAPRETVFEVIAQPYLGRATRAVREKVTVLEQGSDMVLAAHRTPVAGGRLTATTVETVRFTRPERIDFRLVRGPVPAVTETFELTEEGPGTRLVYRGELGADLWTLGRWWGDVVAPRWESAVEATLTAVKREGERRASLG